VRVALDSARSWFSVRLPCSQFLVDVHHPSIVGAPPQPGSDVGLGSVRRHFLGLEVLGAEQLEQREQRRSALVVKPDAYVGDPGQVDPLCPDDLSS